MAVPRSDAFVIVVASTAVTTSPAWSPAVAAGLPVATLAMVAPWEFVSSCTETPRTAGLPALGVVWLPVPLPDDVEPVPVPGEVDPLPRFWGNGRTLPFGTDAGALAAAVAG